MLQQLTDVLDRAGKPTEVFTSPDGSRILVLPYGGRVLGLFAPRREQNFFWTHPALAAVESAREFYASGVWHNSGGDRTWLAPEVDLFFPDFPDLGRYWQPRELDPGNYEVVRQGDGFVLVNRLTVLLSRARRKVALEMTKSISPAPNPFRHETSLTQTSPCEKPLLTVIPSGARNPALSIFQAVRDSSSPAAPRNDKLAGFSHRLQAGGVEYAGYTLHTSLSVAPPSGGDEDTPPLGLWQLLQMPHGGDLLVPTYRRTQPKIYMGEVGPQDLMTGEHLVRYKMRANGEHKIGIRAIATTGRAGYLYEQGEESVLVVRNFQVNPSGEYVDVPWRETEDLGYAVQACNVCSGLGSFSELEYHVPALGGSSIRSHDVSQVWAFRGAAERIRGVAAALLGVEV